MLLLRPIWDVDVFWQLKLGDLALDRGGLIWREPFSASHLGEPLASVSWLAQIVMAAERRIGGWSALQVCDAAVWLGGFLAAANAGRRLSAGPAGILAALVVAIAIALPSASLRPQSFAVLCFGLLLGLLAAPRPPIIKIAFGGVLLVVWQNLHPSVAVALFYLLARAVWGGFAKVTNRSTALPWTETVLMACGALALIATPLGFQIFAVSARNAAASTAMSANEWLPVWSRLNAPFWPSLLAMPVLFLSLVLLRHRKLDWQWLLPCLGLLVASVLVVRFSLFWAVSTIPVVAGLFTAPDHNEANLLPDSRLSVAVLAVAAAVALMINRPQFAATLPVGAIAALKSAQFKGVVYSELGWGGPLIDAGYPDWTVALDGRYYVYSDAELNLARTAGRIPNGLDLIEQKFRPQAILVDPRNSPALAARLRLEPTTWRSIYSSAGSVAFIKIKASASSQLQR